LSDKIESLGYSVDKNTGKIVEARYGSGNGAGLYKLLTENELTANQVGSGYLRTITSELSSYGFDKVVENENTLRKIQLQKELYGPTGAKFDFLGTSTEDVTFKDTIDLLNKTTAANKQERDVVLNYLSGFKNYSETGS